MVAGVKYARRAGVRDQGNGSAFFKQPNKIFAFSDFVVLEIAGGGRFNSIMVEQDLGVPRVLAGNQIHGFKTSMARKVMSLRLPMGVETIYNIIPQLLT